MTFDFVNTNKVITMTKEDEEDYRNYNICRFCEKKIETDKVRDPCHLTGKYRGPAHSFCNINVTQKQSKFIQFIFNNFSNYDCDMFSDKSVDLKNEKVKVDVIPKTNEEYLSVTHGCIRFFDSYRVLSNRLDSLAKTLVDTSHKTLNILKEEIIDKDEISNFVKGVGQKDRTIEDLKKYYPTEIEKLEEALFNYIGENDLQLLKTEFPDK